MSIESATGFIPLFETGGRDNRFLGIRVKMTPLYEYGATAGRSGHAGVAGRGRHAADEGATRRRRCRRSAGVGPVARIVVVTSSPPFVEGGHLSSRASWCALPEAGHGAELLVTPQNRFGRQGAAYLAAWLTDVGMAADGGPSTR